ncbi:hypothetical protein CJU89_0981 [Yarrowia sp. B02]|nr:hypothetical protein CJU89_0981 [Yarrowia sp. B02]
MLPEHGFEHQQPTNPLHSNDVYPQKSGAVPLWFLSPKEENEVREETRRLARLACADVLKVFSECTKGRTVSMLWACRIEKSAMMDCMASHSTMEDFDKARDEFVQKKADAMAENKDRLARENQPKAN